MNLSFWRSLPPSACGGALRRSRGIIVAGFAGFLLLGVAGAESPKPRPASELGAFGDVVEPFLMTYCMDCHSESEQKGDRRFDELPGTIDSDGTLVDFQDILDQLNLSEMPPEEASQPSDEERRDVIQWLTRTLAEYHATKQGGSGSVLRRLNAREYRNTVRDLLHLNMTMFDPTEKFPRDQTTDHLDNVGDTLVTSGHLLARYLDAADLVIRKALPAAQRPEIQEWKFVDNFHQQPEIDQVHSQDEPL